MGRKIPYNKEHPSKYNIKISGGNYMLTVKKSDMLLGSHNANDKILKKVHDNRWENNSIFEGIKVKATRKILPGYEICISYNIRN